MANLESQNHNVIDAGTVCTFENDPLTIQFGPDEDPLAIEFIFKEEEGQKPAQKVTGSGKKLILELLNFNNTLGTGNINPMEIGTLNHKKLFVNFRVYALGQSKTKLIHYTIYQEK